MSYCTKPCLAQRSSRSTAQSISPVFKDIVECLLQGDLWRPAGVRAEAPVVADDARHLGRPHACRVGLDGDVALAEGQQCIEQPADADGATGAHIIDLAGLA